MTDQELLDQARCLRAEAERLLYQDGLFADVEEAGPAVVIGSVALDLMAFPDIDINVKLSHDQDVESFFGIGRAVVARFTVATMGFANEFVRPDDRFDHGLWWGMHLLHEGRWWKFDLWGHGPDAYRTHLQAFHALRAELRTADHLTILRIKDAVRRRPGYPRDPSSMEVYRAVARHSVRTVEDFDSWKASMRRR